MGRKKLQGGLGLRDTPPCVHNSELCPRPRVLNLGTMDTLKGTYHYPSYLIQKLCVWAFSGEEAHALLGFLEEDLPLG